MNSCWLQENFITNVDEIIALAELEKDKFSNRSPGNVNEFVNERYGPSQLFTLFQYNMSQKIKDAIFKTVDKDHLKIMPDDVVINRYDPGCYLARHRDHTGGYYKFFLIFLRTDEPHLKIYNKEYPNGKLVEEKPGALFRMPLSMEHEVTKINDYEAPKYSLVMSWNL